MRAAFLSFGMLVAVACAHAPAILPPTGSDEYDVYQVVLRFEIERFRDQRKKGFFSVPEARGPTLQPPPDPEFALPSVESKLDKEFVAAHRNAVGLPVAHLDAQLRLPPEVQFGVWNRRPSRTTFAFSRVGFDSDHRRAVIVVDMMCGLLCGEGEIIELQRVGQGWSIVKRIQNWVA